MSIHSELMAKVKRGDYIAHMRMGDVMIAIVQSDDMSYWRVGHNERDGKTAVSIIPDSFVMTAVNKINANRIEMSFA